jgi:hypothetical protein
MAETVTSVFGGHILRADQMSRPDLPPLGVPICSHIAVSGGVFRGALLAFPASARASFNLSSALP